MKKFILAIIPLLGSGLTACGSGGTTTNNNYGARQSKRIISNQF